MAELEESGRAFLAEAGRRWDVIRPLILERLGIPDREELIG